MTLPALWIRQNMLQSPGPTSSHNERQLTEAEIKVQQSLKKLSIPEWYLNNSSHPPKILMNDTPFELRPPSWKEQSTKKSVVCSTPIMPIRNATVNRDGVLETEIGPPTLPNQSYGTFKINRGSASNKSPLSKKRASPHKDQGREKKWTKSRLMNVSRTFPRISPSRKIQNINLVFSQPPKSSHSHTITDLGTFSSGLDMSVDSLEVMNEPTLEKPMSMLQSVMTTDLDQSETEIKFIQDSLAIPPTEPIQRRLETPPMSSDTFRITDLDETESPDTEVVFAPNTSETRISKMPNSKLTYIKPWKPPTRPEVSSCVTPEGKFLKNASFKLRASSTPQGSPVSLFHESAIQEAPRESSRQSPTSGLSLVSSKKTVKSPPTSPRKIEPTICDDEEICDACKADSSRSSSSSPSGSRPSSGFRPRNLLPPIGETLADPPQASSPSPSDAFLASKKKSSELESIIKRKQPPGKSLVQEIIEELNEKCRSSAQPTYVSRGSKNFVKKLVKALEKGKTCGPQDERKDATYRRFDDCGDYEDDLEEDVFVGSENGSEDDGKSAAVSTSISYKDTDSSSIGSDSELQSPTAKLDCKYDWNMNSEKNRNEPTATTTMMTTSTPENEDRENDSVYWIPIAKSKLPRTSSLLNMMSRLTTANPGQQSPCISPIKQTKDQKSCTWGTTYRTNDRTRTLRRIDETTILDSGYSDRSRIYSSESSDDTCFDDSESTWTASEIGSNASFSLGSRLRRERRCGGQIVGKPFII